MGPGSWSRAGREPGCVVRFPAGPAGEGEALATLELAVEAKTPAAVLERARQQGVTMADLRFCDLPGTWQHATVPLAALDEDAFEQGIGFDGSSIRGFQAIHESDMLLVPDASTAHVDPFCTVPTLSLTCNIRDPVNGEAYSRDARHVAQKAEAYLAATGIAEVSFWGPEIEFFVLDHVEYVVEPHRAGYAIDSVEAYWNSNRNSTPNLGYTLRNKEGYFPTPPADSLQDFRSEAALRLAEWGIPVEMHHHEVATAGQGEIDMRYDRLTRMADHCMAYKYVLRNVARRHNKTVTFMPKPLFGDNGTGMHTHQSLWAGGRNLFYGDGYADLSETALYYVGGLLTHVDALLALTSPTTNSYRRLVPHYEAPVNVAFSRRNRSAAVRIPMYRVGPAGASQKRVEFRCPDPTCNPYLAFAAMLMAGLDGIRRQIDPVKAGFGPLDKNIYELEPEEAARVRSVPGSLEDALDALEADHAFLLEGEVFTPDLLEAYIAFKRRQIREVAVRPHPYEFYLYFDA